MSLQQESIHRLFRKLSRQLGKTASSTQPENVHVLRTATRRIEAVLGELDPEPDKNQRRLLKQLTKLRRRAGRVRDMDVQIAALRSLKVSDNPSQKTQVLRVLGEMRAKREKKLRKALDEDTIRDLNKRLKRAEAGLTLPQDGFLQATSRLVSRLAKDSGPITEEVLHQYRIAGKRVRYVAELAAKESPEARRVVDQLKRMQDALGEWHDWFALTETVGHIAVNGSNAALLAALQNITRSKFRNAVSVVSETRAGLCGRPADQGQPSKVSVSAARRKPAGAVVFTAAHVA
jgi:CHAD domain-containing protein